MLPVVQGGAVLGVDVGGTAIKSWLLDDGEGRIAAAAVPTPTGDPTGARTADAVAALAARLVSEQGTLAAIGVATPGIVDDAAGVCLNSANLGWRDVPFEELVAARVAVPVVVAQDVRAGAVAEKLTGAGRHRPGGLLFAPVGTGLAVAVVDEEGRPVGSRWAGEVGQVQLFSGPMPGGRVEDVASAGGLARRFGSPDALTVARACAAGDPVAVRLWEETAEVLADVLAWCVAVSGSTTVVLGGGLARSGQALFRPVRARLAERLADFPPVEVLPAHHGTEAAAVGVARLALAARSPAAKDPAGS